MTNLSAMLANPGFIRRELTAAIEKGSDDFTVHYQPKSNLQSGGIVGLEALMRWFHPTYGAISPDLFIPVAEELGAMLPLWDRLLDLVARDVAALGALALPVAVNVSPSLLLESRVLERLAPVLAAHGVPPALLDIEITEGVFIRDKTRTVETMTAIREAGYKIALDDFGTGFSCLSYLVDLPLDVLKLDKSFVATIVTDQKCHAVVEALVTMAHQLGLQVIAEGVETVDQHDFLRRVGADVGQGYYYSHPMEYAALTEWLADKSIEADTRNHRDAVRRVATFQSELFSAAPLSLTCA